MHVLLILEGAHWYVYLGLVPDERKLTLFNLRVRICQDYLWWGRLIFLLRDDGRKAGVAYRYLLSVRHPSRFRPHMLQWLLSRILAPESATMATTTKIFITHTALQEDTINSAGSLGCSKHSSRSMHGPKFHNFTQLLGIVLAEAKLGWQPPVLRLNTIEALQVD